MRSNGDSPGNQEPGSKRFTPSTWSEYLVPISLIMLGLGLLAVLVIVGLAILGLI